MKHLKKKIGLLTHSSGQEENVSIFVIMENGIPLLIITSEPESLRIKAGRFYSFFTEHSTDELSYSINIC